MSKQDVIIFGGAGLATWLALTGFYAAFGGPMIERAFWFYALNGFAAAAAGTFVFQLVARLRRTPRHQRLFPAIAFVLPGLIGFYLLLSDVISLMPGASPASLGRYAAFLVVLYVAVGASVFERGPQKTRG